MKAESVPTTGSNADVDANWNDKNAWVCAATMQAAHAVGLVLTNTGPNPYAI